MNLQSIIQTILGNPILIILLIGGASTIARAIKATKEKQTQSQSRKQDLHQRKLAKRDEMRTGHTATSTPSQPSQPTAAQSKSLAADQTQQLKRERIEQIRLARIEQLQKIRAKRSATTSTAPTQSTPGSITPILRAPVQKQAAQPKQSQQSQQSRPMRQAPAQKKPVATNQTNSAYARKNLTPYAQNQPKKSQQRSDQSHSVGSEALQSTSGTRRRGMTSEGPIDIGKVPVRRDSRSSGAGNRLRMDLRQAIIAKEILGTPVGLRSGGEDGFGTL